MKFHLSNNLVGILNFLTFIISIPILGGGIWLSKHGTSECEKFLDTPIIILGIFLMLVSLAGLIGACCRVTWLLWFYLVVMFLLIVLVFCFTIFAFLVTNKGAGHVVGGKGYKEYKLGDYSSWLRKRVSDRKNWNKIRACLVDSHVCTKYAKKYANDDVNMFSKEKLKATESGCCKPSSDCGFTYLSPTNWTNTDTTSTNTDCSTWSNDPKMLCYNCSACKAGFVDELRSDWKKVATINIIFLIILIIVYTIGCCAFRNNRRDNSYQSGGWKP
ncbi:hypothetical protein ACFE04_010023 [Oxalis oulophora]